MARGSGSRTDKRVQRALERLGKHPNIGTYEDAGARRAFSKGSVPPPAQELPARNSFADGAKAVFIEHVEKTKTNLLLDLNDIDVRARGLMRTVVFHVNANCPIELAEKVGRHAIVRTPLKAFLADMRARHPGVTMKIALEFDPYDTGLGTRASLKLALKLAGATELIKELDL